MLSIRQIRGHIIKSEWTSYETLDDDVRNITKHYETLWNIMKYYELLWIIMKYYGLSLNIMEYYEILWNIMKYYGML